MHISIAVTSEGAVRTGEWLLSRVNSHMSLNHFSVFCLVATDPTLVPRAMPLSVRVETLIRSQRQLAERTLQCSAVDVLDSCICHSGAEIWGYNEKSPFYTQSLVGEGER